LLKGEYAERCPVNHLVLDNPYVAYARISQLFDPMAEQDGFVHPSAYVHESAQIASDVSIAAGVVIEAGVIIDSGSVVGANSVIGRDSCLGKNCRIYPNVTLYHGVTLGCNVIIHSSSVIGGDGFGFAPSSANDYKKVPQVGNVIIEDHVEIGANTCVDRATMGSTIIRKGVKLDNLIQVAHNVEIDENTVIAAQTGIAGSSKVGKNCMIGGQVGLSGHLSIADEVKIAAQSGIGRNIKKAGVVLQGSPAFDFGPYQKSYVLFKNLPKMREQIMTLEKEMKELKK